MKSNFQIILMVVFMAAALFGMLVFAGKINIGKDKNEAGSHEFNYRWHTVCN